MRYAQDQRLAMGVKISLTAIALLPASLLTPRFEADTIQIAVPECVSIQSVPGLRIDGRQ